MITDDNEEDNEEKNAIEIFNYFYGDGPKIDFIDSIRKCFDEKNNNDNHYFFSDVDNNFIKGNFFYVARRFNSYTPALPLDKAKYYGEKSKIKKYSGRKGGGYLISWKNKLIAIDPGYNFIENIYFNENIRIKDIDCIILTHAHPDHVSDFENMLMLLYEYNDELSKRNLVNEHHHVDVFMNVTASQRFLSVVQSNNCVNKIKVLNQGETINLKEDYKMDIKLIKSKHKEFIWDDFSIGLLFELYDNDDITFKLGLTSDTGWYKNLDEKYKKADLLVAHVGGIKIKEIELKLKKYSLNELFYKYHLGFLGTYNLIKGVESKNIVLSEFGEEFAWDSSSNIDNRIRLSEVLSEILSKNNIEKKIIPGDIGLKIRIPDLTVECENCGKVLDFKDVIPTTKPISTGDAYHGIIYLCNSCDGICNNK